MLLQGSADLPRNLQGSAKEWLIHLPILVRFSHDTVEDMTEQATDSLCVHTRDPRVCREISKGQYRTLYLFLNVTTQSVTVLLMK